MIGPRFLFGAIVGGALVYFFDPVQGTQRRERLRRQWEQNREPVLNTATTAANTAQEKAGEAATRVGEKFTELQSKVRREEPATR